MFDKHGFAPCFENHQHTYKRTEPLFGDQIVTGGKGTVYLGDGKMRISGLAVPTLEYITSPVQDDRNGVPFLPRENFNK
jgi:hypothetical protein